jgi:hypothetical protein
MAGDPVGGVGFRRLTPRLIEQHLNHHGVQTYARVLLVMGPGRWEPPSEFAYTVRFAFSDNHGRTRKVYADFSHFAQREGDHVVLTYCPWHPKEIYRVTARGSSGGYPGQQ